MGDSKCAGSCVVCPICNLKMPTREPRNCKQVLARKQSEFRYYNVHKIGKLPRRPITRYINVALLSYYQLVKWEYIRITESVFLNFWTWLIDYRPIYTLGINNTHYWNWSCLCHWQFVFHADCCLRCRPPPGQTGKVCISFSDLRKIFWCFETKRRPSPYEIYTTCWSRLSSRPWKSCLVTVLTRIIIVNKTCRGPRASMLSQVDGNCELRVFMLDVETSSSRPLDNRL